MVLDLDHELYPDDCEVVEMPLHNRMVYLIQKNGSTSLRLTAEKFGLTILQNEQLQKLKYVDVYLRNPRSRYVSGINTFLFFMRRDHPELDPGSIVWFATNYHFLNRHFLPQFHWLINLSRFLDKNCTIRIHDVDDLDKIVDFNDRAGITPADAELCKQILSTSKSLEKWFYLDQILLDQKGKEFTWEELLRYLSANHKELVDDITQKAFSIAGSLDALR